MRARPPCAALAAALLALAARPARAQDGGAPEAGVADAGVSVEAGTGAAGAGGDAGVVSRLDAGARAAADEESELPADRRPEVSLRLSPETGAMTGDLVTAVVTVTLADGDDVAVPRQRFGDLELHDQRHTDRLVDGRRTFTFELDFLMLEPGEHELPPIRLRVVTADGVVGAVRTEPRTIVVGSLTANEPDAQPRPPTPADIVVMQEDYTLAWVLGIAAAMLLSALLGWLLSRWWRARPRALPPPPPPRPPWEVALEKLAALRKELRTVTRDVDAVALVDRTSDALREYLGGRYDFNGLESTTDEVVGRMRNARLGSVSLNEIVALLGDADLVKFAKAVPDQAQCERMIDGAERIVKGTIPMATAVSRPAPDAGLPVGEAGAARAEGAGEGRRVRKSRPEKARAEWNPDIVVGTGRAETAPAETRGSGPKRRFDEDGNPIPDTNPPPPPSTVPTTTVPDAASVPRGEGASAVTHDTLRDGTPVVAPPPDAGTGAPAAAGEADGASRPTPVGFSDPNDRGGGEGR